MKVRPGQLPVTRKMEVALAANGGSLVVDRTLFEASQLDGAKINVSVARPSAFDVPSLILQLDRYPYGCAEQITSKALPLLYSSDFSAGIPGLDEAVVKERIQKVHQYGAFIPVEQRWFQSLGNPSRRPLAERLCDGVPDPCVGKGIRRSRCNPCRQALQSLQNVLAYRNDLSNNDAAVAYALYVLARNRLASAGDLRYYADTQLQVVQNADRARATGGRHGTLWRSATSRTDIQLCVSYWRRKAQDPRSGQYHLRIQAQGRIGHAGAGVGGTTRPLRYRRHDQTGVVAAPGRRPYQHPGAGLDAAGRPCREGHRMMHHIAVRKRSAPRRHPGQAH